MFYLGRFLGLPDSETSPQNDRCLTRNSEQEYCPYIIFEKKHISRYQHRPHQHRYYYVVYPCLSPYRIEDKRHYRRYRNCDKICLPKINSRNGVRKKVNKHRQKPYYNYRHKRYYKMVAITDFLLRSNYRLFVVKMLGKKIIHFHAKHIGYLFQYHY